MKEKVFNDLERVSLISNLLYEVFFKLENVLVDLTYDELRLTTKNKEEFDIILRNYNNELFDFKQIDLSKDTNQFKYGELKIRINLYEYDIFNYYGEYYISYINEMRHRLYLEIRLNNLNKD